MVPQHFSVLSAQALPAALAAAMADLAEIEKTSEKRSAQATAEVTIAAPALIVETPAAAQQIKLALAQAGWPGRLAGAPLPWCGTLGQAFDQLVAIARQAPESDGGPRSEMLRRAQLAQALLDHAGISRSLGGSAKAALGLARQWVNIFEGWEWLAAAQGALAARASPSDDAFAETGLLRALQAQSQAPNDAVAWVRGLQRSPVATYLTASAPSHPFLAAREVWFCMSQTPAPCQLAMAQTLWNVQPQAIRVWSVATPAVLSPPQHTRTLIAASTTEECAWAAVQSILDWRAEGIEDIAVVALDRKAVRRMRALLERAGEPFDDHSGWALDTTMVATAVAALNELLLGRATTQGLLEWIHSPFVQQALLRQPGFDAGWQQELDQALRAFGRVAPITLAQIVASVPRESPQAGFWKTLASLVKPSGPHPIHAWSDQLMQALTHCGLEDAFARDAAGLAVLATLQNLHAVSGVGLRDDSGNRVSAGLWRALLAETMASARFAETLSGAAVRVCGLNALAWQQPGAVLIVGADAARLPEPATAQFFEPEKFAEMGLQNSPEQIQAEAFAEFASIWSAPLPITFLATSEKPDSSVEFSPWLERLTLTQSPLVTRVKAADVISVYALQRGPKGEAAGTSHHAATEYDAATESGTVIAHNAVTAHSATTQWPYALPPQISVSDAQSLVACPYQFFAQRLLGLQPLEKLLDEAAPSDMGSLIHLVLAKAADVRYDNAPQWATWLEQEIDRVLSVAFFERKKAAVLALTIPRALQSRLKADAMAVVPHLSEWLSRRGAIAQQDEHHDQHQYQQESRTAQVLAEQPVTRDLPGVGVRLSGRIDRWEDPSADSLLIDFKTSDPAALKSRVRSADQDVQLPLYAWLIGPEKTARDALYVAIRHDRVSEISVTTETEQPLDDLSQALAERLSADLLAIRQGGPLLRRAMETDPARCDVCRVRGICRRDDTPLSNEDAP